MTEVEAGACLMINTKTLTFAPEQHKISLDHVSQKFLK